MTIRNLINYLEVLAKRHGDEIKVRVLDTYAESEGYDITFEDVYPEANPEYVDTHGKNAIGEYYEGQDPFIVL